MLFLTRRVGEIICIGDDIKIQIIHMSGGIVKIGIDAPLEFKIDREEVKIAKEATKAMEENGNRG